MSKGPETAAGRLDELERLAQLRSNGLITDDEYTQLKGELLQSGGDAQLPEAVTTHQQHAEGSVRSGMTTRDEGEFTQFFELLKKYKAAIITLVILAVVATTITVGLSIKAQHEHDALQRIYNSTPCDAAGAPYKIATGELKCP